MMKRLLKSFGCAAFLPLALAFAQSSQTPPLSARLAAIDRVVKDACHRDVVLLGEDASHGSGRTFEVKTRLIERLVTECGFGAVLFESQFYDFLEYERDLEDGRATRQGLADAIGALWSRALETQPLIDRLHALATTGKVRLGGIDPQVGGVTGYYSQRHLGTQLASVLDSERSPPCIVELNRHHTWAYNREHAFDDAAKSRLRACVRDIGAGALAPRSQARVSPELLASAKSYARYAALALDGDASARDLGMSENFTWHLERWPRGAKVIVWTATVHAAKTRWPGSPYRPLGAYLHESMHGRAFTLGFTARRGSYSRPGGRGASTPLPDLEPGSLETLSAQAPSGGLAYADLKALRALGPVPGRIFNYSESQTLDWSSVVDGVVVLDEETGTSPIPSSAPLAAIPWFVYFGTYTAPGKSRGIYVASFDGATGKLGAPRLAAETESPSFLALHPTRPLLYAVNEVASFEGRPHGSVSAFEVDAVSGDLRPLGGVSSEGAHPAHLVVDRSGGHVLVANYTGGSVASLPVRKDGGLGAAVEVVRHTGSSVHPKRQTAPHAHMVQMDPSNRHALVADLGLDQLLTYQFDAGRLTPLARPARLVPGSGPRHLAFSPEGGEVYVLNEMSLSITAFRYAAGGLTEFQTLSALPEGQEPGPADSGAAILVHPSGRFVYASLRGLDQVAVFSRDGRTGDLRLVEHVPSGGKAPRSFAIEPRGRYLFVANQRSDQVTVFDIDPTSGGLKATGQSIEVPTPVALTFMSASPASPLTSAPGEQSRDGRMGR